MKRRSEVAPPFCYASASSASISFRSFLSCFEDESHFNGLLEYPQYTRPAIWHGRAIPEILTSGNHEKVRQWRRKQSLRRTRARRPDMYEKLDLSSKQDRKLLKEMEAEDAEA